MLNTTEELASSFSWFTLPYVSHYSLFDNFVATNMRFFETFVRNKSQMQIWAPRENQISINERTKEKIMNQRFWNHYLNETNNESLDELL